ncbi:glutamic-type intramembrane protease PrsW [Alkalihalobacterium chitinilyticum]|uniref:Protease PrsW n=1 Tax=Alkalihalobacterium chitinilyticum TaxID=2980103 RepID=A0ABT5V939_9BACI|nr:glutamic-type intramembrane protease PrsW [Alkalihalobacterium chitinilyticum]MDE5411956.1 glutamic-type intramembrane protease PrsW [Alkalihalobacterium chitinilyticum]
MFSLITATTGPAMALFCYFYLKNDVSHQALLMIIKTFIIGALLVFPVMVIQYAIEVEGVFTSEFTIAFFGYAFTEEFFKWFLLFFFAYKHATFNKTYDGIIYGVSISLGFASVENFFYLIANGLETAWLRALFPVSSHALFGVIMGYYLGKAKFSKKRRNRYVLFSLFLPILLHGSYDLILLTMDRYIHITMLLFMIGLWTFSIHKVKMAN